jgi:hypothetical protein
MRTMKQPSQATSIHTYSCVRPVLLVLLGALGAACADSPEPEPGLLVLDRDAHDFGQVRVGQRSDERTLTVRNAGSEPLDDLAVRFEPEDAFTLLGTTCSGWLEASDACTVTVAFTPSQAGPVASAVVIEADRANASAALTGVGAVLVRVTRTSIEDVTVESEPAGIRCGVVCEAIFTVPEIVLSVPETGLPSWQGSCELTRNGDCLVRLRQDVSISLFGFTAGVQWAVTGRGLIDTVAIDPENNIIRAGRETPMLSKLSPTGELLWQTDTYGPGTAAVDSQGNIALAGFNNVVWKIRPDGGAQWSVEFAEGVLDVIGAVAFDPDGNVYVTGTAGSTADNAVHLFKYSNDGGLLWQRTYAPATSNSVYDLVVDLNGDVIIAGSAWVLDEEGSRLNFLRKFNGDGDIMWFDEAVEDNIPSGLAVDSAGNLFVADYTAGSYSISKYMPGGARIWNVSGADPGGLLSDLAVTAQGDVIAIGTHLDGDGEAVGAWAAKFDALDGTRRRPVQIELGGGGQYGHAVAVDGEGNVLLSGGESPSWLRKYDGAELDRPE